MIDFHVHILPRMDDGSKSVDESLKMLAALGQQGVSHVVATPHFYANRESVDSFLQRRQAAYEALRENMSEALPKMTLGAEVQYYDGISHLENLKSLRAENTKFLLVEMPFTKWTEYAVNEVTDVASRGKITLVLAHIERYFPFTKAETLSRLRQNGVLFQVNASFFEGTFRKAKALSMLRKNEIHFIGSDSHNMAERRPNVGKAVEVIRKKFGEAFVQDYVAYSHELFTQNVLDR